jgi:predicted ArsR family transcriptional regulator
MKSGVQYLLLNQEYYRIIYVRCENNETFKRKKVMNTTTTKSQALIEALQKGEQLTAKQITSRFGIANPTATVSDLRIRGGFAVYANKRTNKRGDTYTKYRLGTPSRAVVAAGYKALSMGLV